MNRILHFLLLFGFLGAHAAQSSTCQINMTWNECSKALEQSFGQEERQGIAKSMQEKSESESLQTLINANTGVGAGELGTNKTDFQSLFNLIGLVAGGDGDGMAGDTVRFEHTFLRPEQQGLGGKFNISLDSTPSVSDAVRMALPEEERDDQISALENTLQLGDDITLELELATPGRTIKAHQKMLNTLFSAVADNSSMQLSQLEASHRQAFSNFIGKIQEDIECQEAEDCNFVQIAQAATKAGVQPPGIASCTEATTETCARQIMQLFMARRQQDFAYEKSLEKGIQDAGIDNFASLVDNEKQFVFSAKGLLRDELVGPEQFEVKLSYQGGGPSLSEFKEDNPLPEDAQAKKNYLENFTDYAKESAVILEKKLGWSLSASYAWIDSVDLMRPDDGIELQADSIERWSVEAGLKRAVRWDENKMPTSLVELIASWQDFSDDTMRQDRLVASLTWTQQVGEMSIPFGLVYASKTEFLTDESDYELSARFGIKFKIGDLGGG